MDCSMPSFPVHQQLPELTQTHVHWVGDTIQPSHPLSPLLLPSIFPSIRVFSKESFLCIRWPKYWNFSFSISPFSEYSGLISFRPPSVWSQVKQQGGNTAPPINRKLDKRLTEHGPTHQNKTQYPPQSLPSGSFHKPLSFSIRGQTDWKPQSQKTNQSNHMDHSLL